MSFQQPNGLCLCSSFLLFNFHQSFQVANCMANQIRLGQMLVSRGLHMLYSFLLRNFVKYLLIHNI